MKNHIFGIVMVICVIQNLTAQNLDCNAVANTAKLEMKGKLPFHNYKNIYESLSKCTDQGHATATNYFGIMHLQGFGIDQNVDLGFQYIQTAAEQGNAQAQYNLGRLYKTGMGCALNLNTAINWYHKAAAQGNQKAIYILGYMHYKGLGVAQNYQIAVEWFKQSDYQMAKQLLAMCYYFGYGVSQNTEIAIAYLEENDILNSSIFLQHIYNNKNQEEVTKVTEELESYVHPESAINVHAIKTTKQSTAAESLKEQDVLGDWVGKLVEFDESGTRMTRVLPIAISFSQADSLSVLQTKIILGTHEIEEPTLLEQNNLFVDNFSFILNKQYTQHPKQNTITYKVLGMDVSKTMVEEVPYLLLDVEAYFEVWKEETPPISIVLRPKEADKQNLLEQDQDLLLALASQKDDFIKLYPVPFQEQLFISFNLEKEETLSLSIANIKTGEIKALVSQKVFGSGIQEFTINATDLDKGIYIVRLITGSFIETKLVTKD